MSVNDPTQNTLTVIHNIQEGKPLNGIKPADCGEWSDVITEVIAAYEQSGPAAAMRAISIEPELLKLASQGKTPPNPWRMIALMPDLPSYARLTPNQERQAVESSVYLNTYVDYSQAKTPMLPAAYHESAALYLGAVAIARRLKLEMPYGTIYPNLYQLWIASTTLFNKSTALDTVKEIVRDVVPHLRLTSEFSREALIDSLSGKEPPNQADLRLTEKEHARWQLTVKFAAQRGIVLDEASSLFAGLKREINTGMTELLMSLYDCTDYDRVTRNHGLIIVKRPYINFLGATTPFLLKQASNTQLWFAGFWPRFNLLLPRTMPNRLIDVTVTPQRPELLTGQLEKLANHHLMTPATPFEFPEARCVAVSSEVFEAHRRYNRALREGILMSGSKPPEELWGTYGRLPTAALKVAITLSALEWDGANNVPTITPQHWYKAQMIAEGWREGAHLFYRELNDAAKIDSLEQQILSAVVRHIDREGECARRDVYRNLSKTSDQVSPIIDAMIEAGLLKETMPDGRRKKLLSPGDDLPADIVSSSKNY